MVIEVKANGICRSDWHGWMGHDPDIHLPHVPGHELAGVIVEVGKNVQRWQTGDRVTLPFVCGCGTCPQCLSGNQQVCDHQFQPGFTHWGSFAQYVAIYYADDNLVRLPNEIDFVTAASLGCRFVTSFRGIVDQGKVSAGQWVAVHGCGGVGLSAIMIAAAVGAQVVAVDIDDAKLDFARSIGAAITINSKKVDECGRSGQGCYRRRCACINGRIGKSGDMFQFDFQLAQTRQAYPGGVNAGWTEPSADPDGQGCSK